MKDFFDVCVVGAGHAGIEACNMASLLGAEVALISLSDVPMASAPCNPSIGGIGKGQVVKEIDALGGLMGVLADAAGIQYRSLNESRGYAVRSTRIQIDKFMYSEAAEQIVRTLRNVTVIRNEIVEIVRGSENQYELYLKNGIVIRSTSVVITAGTFLAGSMHCGAQVTNGGRVGSSATNAISSLIRSNLVTRRFKTGTPPRIYSGSIDFSKMEPQPSDNNVMNMSLKNEGKKRSLPQLDCFLTRTNELAMQIIRNNKSRSPMYNGQISGIGARYCPSIEDKAFRYPDRNVHHVFLEPEDLSMATYYPSGISTSLPKDIQLSFIRSISGLECAEFYEFGYAVEYDVIDTFQLDRTLQVKSMTGLYFAGQINGTSGYEEAAGQGLVAGINAAHFVVGKEPLILDRSESYIGLMIDDLVSSSRDEPYRLFTSRSENRLYLREDNAFIRMYKYRKMLGLPDSEIGIIESYSSLHNLCTSYLQKMKNNIAENFNQTYLELLKNPNNDPPGILKNIFNSLAIKVPEAVLMSVAIGVKYDGYIKKDEEKNKIVQELDKKKLNIEKILLSKNISYECKQRITRFRPYTFADLKKMAGIRPATLVVVASDNL